MHAKVDQRLTINFGGCDQKRHQKDNEVYIMALKKLNQFNHFDTEGFFSKIKLITVGNSVWKEYGSNVVKGTKLEVVIAGDKHMYNCNEGEAVNNMYEKLTVKVPKEMDVPMNVEVKLVNPEANIYGEYRNQLSIVAEDVQVVSK